MFWTQLPELNVTYQSAAPPDYALLEGRSTLGALQELTASVWVCTYLGPEPLCVVPQWTFWKYFALSPGT